MFYLHRFLACLKIAFWQLWVTLLGRFVPDEGRQSYYAPFVRGKYAAKRGVQMAGMNFQTGSSTAWQH
ncbi:DUF6783 domain-containing protein [Robinsoniella peoriensis]